MNPIGLVQGQGKTVAVAGKLWLMLGQEEIMAVIYRDKTTSWRSVTWCITCTSATLMLSARLHKGGLYFQHCHRMLNRDANRNFTQYEHLISRNPGQYWSDWLAVVNGLYLYFAFLSIIQIKVTCTHSSITHHSYTAGTAIRGHFWRFSVLPKDTSACRGSNHWPSG